MKFIKLRVFYICFLTFLQFKITPEFLSSFLPRFSAVFFYYLRFNSVFGQKIVKTTLKMAIFINKSLKNN